MPSILLPIIPGTFDPSYCWPSSPQAFLVDAAAQLKAYLASGNAFYNDGTTKPDPSLNGYPWFNRNDGRWYFYNGDWIAPSNLSPYERRIFRGDQAALNTYDGGDTGAPSDRSGAMWQIDTDFNGRSPMGAGDIPASTPAKTLGLDEPYGEGTHQLTKPELPNYSLTTNQDFQPVTTDINDGQEFASGGSGARRHLVVTSGGSDTPHNNVQPVIGVYFIKPSGRLFYRVP